MPNPKCVMPCSVSYGGSVLADSVMASLAQLLFSVMTIRRFEAFFLEEFGFGIKFRSCVLK